MENTQYTVKVDNTMATPFTVDTGLKQGDALSPILFNLVLEKVVRELQCLRGSQVTNNDNGLRILGFADDLDIIGNSLTEIANASRELEKAAEKVDLIINTNKTKLMELRDSGIDPQQREGLTFEKVEEF